MASGSLTAVIDSANKIWSLQAATLEEFSDEHLARIWAAVPAAQKAELVDYAQGVGAELLTKLAQQARQP